MNGTGVHRRIPLRSLLAATLLLFSGALTLPTVVAAHAELVTSDPIDAAALAVPPTEVSLVFDDELDPLESGFVVTDPTGSEVGRGEVDLSIAERSEIRGALEITEPGSYTVAWIAVASDDHVSEGTVTFTYAPSPVEEAPDTRMEPPGDMNPLVVAGFVCVGLALLTALGRVVLTRSRR